MSAYAYPPPQQQQQQQQQQQPQPQQQPVEPYRASPTGSHVSLPSLNLPPIRHTLNNDHRSPQQQGPPPMGTPLPPPGAPMAGYYAQSLSAPQHMNVTSSPHNQPPHRYPLPQSDGRIMSGGRHKKEIKRRTKTGCLTCRKRRIKVSRLIFSSLYTLPPQENVAQILFLVFERALEPYPKTSRMAIDVVSSQSAIHLAFASRDFTETDPSSEQRENLPSVG
jgi:hypothetical protein